RGWGRRGAGGGWARVQEQREVPPPTVPATPMAPITALPMSPGVIEVEFKTGARLRIRGPVDVPTLAAVVQALTNFGRRSRSSGDLLQRALSLRIVSFAISVTSRLPA